MACVPTKCNETEALSKCFSLSTTLLNRSFQQKNVNPHVTNNILQRSSLPSLGSAPPPVSLSPTSPLPLPLLPAALPPLLLAPSSSPVLLLAALPALPPLPPSPLPLVPRAPLPSLPALLLATTLPLALLPLVSPLLLSPCKHLFIPHVWCCVCVCKPSCVSFYLAKKGGYLSWFDGILGTQNIDGYTFHFFLRFHG